MIGPNFDHAHSRVLRHPLAIRTYDSSRASLRIPFVQANIAGRDDKTRSQTFDVPLPRRRQSFVKIVDIEDELALRRGKRTEIQKMTVTTSLDAQSCCRRVRKVRCHYRCRTAEKGERGRDHPAMANRHQFGETLAFRFHQDLDDVRTVTVSGPTSMLFARDRSRSAFPASQRCSHGT